VGLAAGGAEEGLEVAVGVPYAKQEDAVLAVVLWALVLRARCWHSAGTKNPVAIRNSENSENGQRNREP
jgi:hypothetical protein